MESRLIKEYREAEEKIEKKKLDFLAIKQKQAQEKAEAEAKAPQPDEIEYRKLFEENMRAESEFNSAQDAYAKRLERILRLEEGIRDWRPIVMKQMKRDREHFQDGLASGYIVSTSHGYVEFDMEGKSSHDLPSGPSKAEEQLAYLEEELTNCKIEIVREEVARDIANNKYEKTSHALLEYMQTTGFSPTEAQREEAQKAAEINTNPKLLAAERKRQAEKEKRLEEELQKAEWQIRLATDEWIQKRHQILKINFLCFEEAMYLHQKGSLATVINEAKAETEARMKAEFKAHAEAKAKADAETKTLAEAKAKALAEAKAKAEAEAKMKKGKRRQLNFSFVEREALSASTLISKAFGGTEAILSLESNDEGVRSYGEGEAWTAVTVVRFVGGHVVKCMWRRHHSHDYGDTAELGAVTVRFYESPDNGQERNKTEQKFATPESIAALANKIGLTLSDHPYHCQGHAGTYAPWPEDLRDLEFRDDLGREEGDTNPPAKLSPRPQSC